MIYREGVKWPLYVVHIAAILAILIIAACRHNPKNIHFIVSSGYRGPIAVIASPEFSKPEAYGSRAEGYILVVPKNGVVCIPSDTIFNGFLHTAEYADGSTINHHGPHAPDSSAITLDAFGAWGGDTRHHGVTWFGVGTKAEISLQKRAFNLGNIQNLMPPGITIHRNDLFENHREYCK